MTGSSAADLREPPIAGNEADTLLGTLERMRRTFAWKCGGLDADGIRARLGPGKLTIGGLLKHLALVEDDVFGDRLLGEPFGPPWDKLHGDDPDWHLTVADDDTPEQLMTIWQDAVGRSRERIGRVLADGDLGMSAHMVWPDGNSPSLRRLLVDMIEEYGRHIGHADLIRESIDGLVGEDPPG
jgi:hypothetical protein